MVKILGFDPNIHNWKTAILAGFTSFLTMSYILAVNPGMFSILEGMPQGAVFSTTALVAIISSSTYSAVSSANSRPECIFQHFYLH